MIFKFWKSRSRRIVLIYVLSSEFLNSYNVHGFLILNINRDELEIFNDITTMYFHFTPTVYFFKSKTDENRFEGIQR